MALIVGIHNTGVLSSAALVVDGRLEFGAAEERFDRQKYSKYFPHRAIAAGLKAVGATLSDVDVFAVAWNPGINIADKYRAGFSEWPAHPGERLYANPNHILPKLDRRPFAMTEQTFFGQDGVAAKFAHVNHHLAHCANSYFLSGFPDAALFSCDGYGERATTAWGGARAGEIAIVRQTEFPHSIGSLYSAVTQHLGFRPDLDEWKVMGAAAYGDAGACHDALRKLIEYGDDGSFELDLRYFNHFNFDRAGLFAPRIAELIGPALAPGAALSQHHFNIAAGLQKIVEDYLLTALRWLARTSPHRRLCLSGGVLMNSLFNGRLAAEGLFDEVYIPFAPDDSGNSIGAALWMANRMGERRIGATLAPYLGPDYDEPSIKAVLDQFKLPYLRPQSIAKTVARLLAEGKITGWFQGRMEFGQRALGGRSILADPRDPSMKERLNASVKYREAFRPFAPALRREDVSDWFSNAPPTGVPYMERALPVREAKRGLIPAAVHADGTGRVQSVDRAWSPLFYDLIAAFGDKTGVPVLINTSFNIAGEPIVESPADAVRTFFGSGLDILACGPFLLAKDPALLAALAWGDER
ncbi:MAG: carbamoyltransferase [Rhodospirillales bacterium]|nr:carbamoyltransferase [Rhodospirillales bacterium]